MEFLDNTPFPLRLEWIPDNYMYPRTEQLYSVTCLIFEHAQKPNKGNQNKSQLILFNVISFLGLLNAEQPVKTPMLLV